MGLNNLKPAKGSTQKNKRVGRGPGSGLGLRRMHHVVERLDTPEIRGMVKKVPHLVRIVD